MKYIKIILPVMLLSFSTFSQNIITGFSWSMAFATGETSDYIGAPSFSGFELEGHRMTSRNVSFGLMSGWNVLNEQSNESITVENTTITGEQGRYVNVIPILVSASYYIRSNRNAKFIPFIRAHVGTYYILQRFDIGVYTFNNYNWHFGVAPEVGFMYNVSRDVGILVNSRYNYAFDSGTKLSGDETNDYTFVTLNLGIAYFR